MRLADAEWQGAQVGTRGQGLAAAVAAAATGVAALRRRSSTLDRRAARRSSLLRRPGQTSRIAVPPRSRRWSTIDRSVDLDEIETVGLAKEVEVVVVPGVKDGQPFHD
jgi:3-hydroxyacyl-CoA dehydrogenase